MGGEHGRATRNPGATSAINKQEMVVIEGAGSVDWAAPRA